MCLIVFAHRVHPEYSLLVAANRDEYYQRPTESAQLWPSVPGLLAGRDLQAGGTWLGITRSGRFAAITNHRNPPDTPAQPRSRGLLTLDFLSGTDTPAGYLQQLAADAGHYAGFNLLLGDGKTLCCFSNVEGRVRELPPGIYGLSNALLDTPWPKLTLGTGKLGQLLEEGVDHDALQQVVSSRAYADDEDLPDTGVGLEFERMLSAQFIQSPDYGTRTTTSLYLKTGGRIHFAEANFQADGERESYREFELESAESVGSAAGG